MRETLMEYCLEYSREELLQQWHVSNNCDLQPANVSYGSHKKIWWRCKEGHEWQSAVYTRTEKAYGCPYCGNRKLLAGFNDLKTVEPLVAAQWHPTKNESLEPTMVMPGSENGSGGNAPTDMSGKRSSTPAPVPRNAAARSARGEHRESINNEHRVK